MSVRPIGPFPMVVAGAGVRDRPGHATVGARDVVGPMGTGCPDLGRTVGAGHKEGTAYGESLSPVRTSQEPVDP